jgi:ABC-2 type transport system ATP-binding protein
MRKHVECRVELLGVSKSYGRIRAVNNLSLAIRAGEIYGLLGPNGVGKTTTLKMIVGLLRPDSGTVTVCGANVVTERERALMHVGYMPENPIVFDNLKVIEFFRFVASLRSIPRDLFQERLERYVSLFHLGDELRKKMGKLSRGNVQKVLAVAALLPEPDVLVMDEPMSGMDPEAQHVFKEEVKRVAGRGASVILSSHQLGVVERLCTRIGVMYAGRLLAEGTLDEVKNKAGAGADVTLEEVYLKLVSGRG